MNNYLILFLLSFSISLHLDAHSHNSSEEKNTTFIPDLVFTVGGTIRNVGELFSHAYEIYKSGSAINTANLYHAAELTGHSGNILNYFGQNTRLTSFLLVIFNTYAIKTQFNAAANNIATDNLLDKISGAFCSLDVLGHVVDNYYAIYSLFKQDDREPNS